MKIAIVDDSEKDIEQLNSYIRKYCSENRIDYFTETFNSAEELLDVFEKDKFDLLFMDIYLNKMDGLSAAKRIREYDDKCLIVFVTVSTEHAVESYRVRAFDYLLKPYYYENFETVFSLCVQNIGYQSLYIEVKEKRIMVKILLRDIIYTDYYNHYIQIHTKDRVIKTYMKFQDFAPMLLFDCNFLNCYRNCIINMNMVKKITDCGFLMETGEIIPIMRAKYLEMKQKYADYLFKKLDNGNISG